MALIDDFYQRDLSFKQDFVVTAAGDLELIEGLENLKQALFHRLITQPGTLMHRPDYGVGIKSFQNALNSGANRAELFNRIREQFAQDPRIESVSGLEFKYLDQTADKLEILVRVKPVGYEEQQFAYIPFGEVV